MRFRGAQSERVFFRQNADGTIKSARGDFVGLFPGLKTPLPGLKLTDLTAASSHHGVLGVMIAALEHGFAQQNVRLTRFAGARFARLSMKALPGGGFVTELVPLVAEATDVKPRDQRPKVAPLAPEQLANVSHEIRTPLNAVIGFADALRQESFGPLGNHRYRDYAKLIQESGQHVLSLVNDLLDLSKAQANKVEVNKTPVKIAELIESCVAMISLDAENAGLRVVVKTSPQVGTVQADPKILRQVIINLLSNALKFTDHGTITVRTRILDNRLVLSVEDTGVGMSPEDLARIGERFYQARTAGVRGARGSGLGLALSQELAKAHGGRLDLQSSPGHGTRATLTVPVFAQKRNVPSRDTYRMPNAKQPALGADWLDNERRMPRSA